MTAPGARIRVKLLGNFASPAELCRQWEHMSQGQLRWNDIEVTDSDRDIDFYAIINAPGPGDHFVPERSIVFQMEPWCPEPWQTWGVKTWGEWATPDPARFLQVRSHRTHLNNAFWQLRASYGQLRSQPIVKTRTLATICSGKYYDPGHIKRVDFLKFLERKDDDVVRVDLYARDNPLGFTSWVGPVPDDDKEQALAPYRYFFAAENNREHNFITEKLFEPLLTETLCFYWGCPNVADWLDPRAYIVLDLDDFEGAFQTMKSAILAKEWEQRLDAIRREKRKVLEQYQFFPTLEHVLQHELRLGPGADDLTVRYHKYFAQVPGDTIDSACFIHSYTRKGNTTVLAEMLASLQDSGLLAELACVYVVNCGDAITPSQIDAFGLRDGRVEIIEYSPDASRGEAPTLDLVKAFASFHPEAKLLYLHTKGASHAQPSASVDDWRRMMLHFLVVKHLDACAGLADNDVVGCNLLEVPQPHFSGNFWWANARYLRGLPPVPTGDRHAAEWWVLGADEVTAASLHDSGVDHYRQAYPAERYADNSEGASTDVDKGELPPTSRQGQSSICLVMIVRNEAHIINEALASMRPWISECVVVDTGSTDGTQDLIRRYGEANGLRVQLFERAWRDFGANRSEALALAREHAQADYLWMFDADDLLQGIPELKALQADAYHVRFGPDTAYRRLQVFRRTLPWRYVGVVHEYPACDSAGMRTGDISGDYHVVSRRMGDRSRDPLKYARDAALLEAALVHEPGNTRNLFYLGQSWYDAGEPAKALDAYERRIAMGGWSEEVFYARYRAAMCREALQQPYEDVVAAFETCGNAHLHRAEPWVRAARFARRHDRFRDAYVFARRGGQLELPDTTALFVDTADYRWRATDEQAIAAYYCGLHEESFELCSALLEGTALPESERMRVEVNRDFAAPAMLASLARYNAQRIAMLAARPLVAEPEVTLTITSCRRLDLFMTTVSSFLAACSDIERIGRFICIDDNSSEADRAVMREKFPFFEFIWKGPEDRGHARSLNLLRDSVRSPWWLHLEDDWQFLVRRPYVAQAIEILEQEAGLGQVLFNRNYAETLDGRDIVGGLVRRTSQNDIRYRVHQHLASDSPDYARHMAANPGRSNAWWPHYSLRPSLLRTSALREVGAFDETAAHFERDYAHRYVHAGYGSAFLDGVHALHTGRLTSERNQPGRANAYALNGMPQFGEPALAPLQLDDIDVTVINLARRPDRMRALNHNLSQTVSPGFAARVQRFDAIDGRELELLPQIRHLFRGNDFNYRAGFIASALSHLAVWQQVAAGERMATLVLEDDVDFCADFEARLQQVLSKLNEVQGGFDVVLLGFMDWHPRSEDDYTQSVAAPELRPFEGSRYLGGSFAYLLTRRGAQRLLDIADRDGIQNGIDRFIHVKEGELAIYTVSPHLAGSPLVRPGSGGDSDIQNDFAAVGAPR